MVNIESKPILGSASFNVPEKVLLLLTMLVIGLFAMYTFRYTDIAITSSHYWTLSVSGFLILLGFPILRFLGEKRKVKFKLPMPIVYESEMIGNKKIPRWLHVLLISISLIIGIVIFFLYVQTPTLQLLGAPGTDAVTAQLFAEAGPIDKLLWFFMTEFAEDIFFWPALYAIFFASIFLFFRYVFKLSQKSSFWIATILVVMLLPWFFTQSHLGHYSPEQVLQLNTILLMGLGFTLYVTIFRNLVFPILVHLFNNLGFYFGTAINLASPMLWMFFIIAIILVITILYLLHYKKKTGSYG